MKTQTAQQAAEQIAADLEKSIGYYSDEKPEVLSIDGVTCVAWEAGPFDWTMNDGYGLFEELAPMLAEFGQAPEYKERQFFTVPDGFRAEPNNGYVLAVYED